MHRRWAWIVCLLAAAAGCAPAPPPGTGAREVVQAYYEAIVRQDGPGAYAAVHPDSRRGGAEQFARLAQHYRRGLGFEPDAVQVRSCEEHGDEAIAHVVLTGRGPSGARRYQDAVTLRRDGDRWGVVLPPGFGQAGR